MKKLNMASAELSEAVGGWTKVSEHLYVHASGVRIERRGYPDRSGWYLVSPVRGEAARWFPPTVAGCDEAFVAFASRHAVAAFLTRVFHRAG